MTILSSALQVAALVALVVLPYVFSVSNGFVYDDVVLILAKPAPPSLTAAFSVFTDPHHPSGLQYYRPLSALTLLMAMVFRSGRRS